MNEFEFELIFKISDDQNKIDSLIELLYEAGCDDAVIGSGKQGMLGFMFTREAKSAQEAFESAISNIKSVIPDAKLIEAKPDFAGISDIAEFARCTRQNILKIFSSTEAPVPIHTGGQSYWHLSDALTWLSHKSSKYDIPKWQIDTAATAKALNFVIEESRNLPIANNFRHLVK